METSGDSWILYFYIAKFKYSAIKEEQTEENRRRQRGRWRGGGVEREAETGRGYKVRRNEEGETVWKRKKSSSTQ